MKIESEILQGAVDTSPLVLAAIPFGLIYGALSISIGLSPWETLSMSLFVFAGSSQFIAISLLSTAAAIPVILLAVFFVNLRHMLYAINLMPHVANLSQKVRIPMAFWLTDETFAVVSGRVEKKYDKIGIQFYYFGSAIVMYLVWSICTIIGIFLGQNVPDITSWGLDVAMILTFIGIVVPKLKVSSDWICAAIALLCTLFTYNWPNQIGLIFSSILAIIAGQIFKNINFKASENYE